MSLSQRNLSSIQKAGQAVHSASEAIATAVLEQAQSMVARIANQPYDAASEQALGRFKLLSGLSQGLIAVEARLQELYAIAGELANPASDVIVLPSIGSRKSAANAAAVDVVAKPIKAAKKSKRAGRARAALSPNDAKLLAFLQGRLKADESVAMTGSQMAKGSKLPLGSVGLSLKKLVATGAVKITGRGSYQLGASPTLSPAPASQPASAKRAKPASKKAKPVAAEVPADKAVKAVSTTNAKAVKKSKSAAPSAPVTKTAKTTKGGKLVKVKVPTKAKSASEKSATPVVEVPAPVGPAEEQAAPL